MSFAHQFIRTPLTISYEIVKSEVGRARGFGALERRVGTLEDVNSLAEDVVHKYLEGVNHFC